MSRNRKWPIRFPFNEETRRDITLGPGTRLHPTHRQLELNGDAGAYDLGEDLCARTRVLKPRACRKWASFCADTITPDATRVRYRLSDGVTDFVWNTSANTWIPLLQPSSEWNSEEEIAAHIGSWPDQALSVVINLITQQASRTPAVREIRLLYDTDLVGLEDYIARSFIPELREKMRPVSVLAVKSTCQSRIDLSALQTPYDVVAIDAVYNTTRDPDRMRPLTGVAFDVLSKLLFIPAQPKDDAIDVRFVWRPEVVLSQSQDYTEIAKIPVILLDSARVEKKRRIPGTVSVIDKGTGHGFEFAEGYQADIRVPLVLFAASARDLHVMNEEASRYFANTRMLHVRGQDEYYPITADTGFDDGRSLATQNEVYSASFEASIRNAIFYPEDARPITAVLRLSTDMTAQSSNVP